MVSLSTHVALPGMRGADVGCNGSLYRLVFVRCGAPVDSEVTPAKILLNS